MLGKIKEFFASKKSYMKTIEGLRQELAVARGEPKPTVVNNIMKQDSSNVWHLIIDDDGNETWIKPKRVSYISPIKQNKKLFEFNIIIDSNSVSVSFTSKDQAIEFRNIILNIDTIPSANTYEVSKQSMNDFYTRHLGKPRDKITQQDVEDMVISNKMPDEIKYCNDSEKVRKFLNKKK